MAVELKDVLEADSGDAYDYKPTLVELRRWADVLNGEFGDFATAQDFEELVYRQDYDTNVREGTDAVRTGSAPSDLDAAVDSLVPSDLLIRVRPARNHRRYQDQADKLQKFAMGLWHNWRKNKDVLRLLTVDMALRRFAAARVLIDDSLWPPMPRGYEEAARPSQDKDEGDDEYALRVEDWDERRLAWEARYRRRLPIILDRRDPRYTRWRENQSNGEILVVTEKYQTTVLEARAAFGSYDDTWRVLFNKEDNDKVWVTDVWYGRYRCLLLDDQPLFPVGFGSEFLGVARHPYSEIPYVFAPYREVPAESPVDRYRGMLTNAAGLYPVESETVTMAVEIMRWYAWPAYIGHTNDGRDIDFVPGMYNDIRKDSNEYLERLQGDAFPPQLLDMASTMAALTQKNTVANTPMTGARSAQQLMAMNAEREKKLDAPRQSLQRFVARCTTLAAMELEQNLDGRLVLPVPGHDREGNDFGEVVIKASDVNGYYDGFEVNFSRRLDPAVLEVNKTLMSMAQNNFISQRKALELGGIVDNPQEELDELLDQATERQPWMTELLALKRAELYFGEDSWQYQLVLQKFQQEHAQKPPAGGPPGGAPGGMAQKPMQPPGMRGAGQQANGPMMDQMGSAIGQSMAMGGNKPGGGRKGR